MNIQLILVPYDSAQHRWRMGAGPDRLMDAGLLAHLAEHGHDVETFIAMPDPAQAPAEIRTAFELMRRVAERVRGAVEAGRFPLVLSGNCNTAPGTLAGLTPQARGVFWFDAHGDLNTPDTTHTGFMDGTALAAALGLCWRTLAASIPGFEPVAAENTLLLGARDLDPGEADYLANSAVSSLSRADLRQAMLDAELARIAPHIGAAYLHCDMDVLDPAEGQANPYPVPGGLRVAEVESLIQTIGAAVPLKAAAITAYAPEFDSDGRVAQAAFRFVDAILAAAGRA